MSNSVLSNLNICPICGETPVTTIVYNKVFNYGEISIGCCVNMSDFFYLYDPKQHESEDHVIQCIANRWNKREYRPR